MNAHPSWILGVVWFTIVAALLVAACWLYDKTSKQHWVIRLIFSLIFVICVFLFSYKPIREQYRREHIPAETSEIEARVSQLSYVPDKPAKRRIDFYNRGIQTLNVRALRRNFVTTSWPKNPDSLRFYLDQEWDKFASHAAAGSELLVGPHMPGYVPTDDNDALTVSSQDIKEAKTRGEVPTLVVMGFFQYQDSAGAHQTDYCAFYRGIAGEIISCPTHVGVGKPTPLE